MIFLTLRNWITCVLPPVDQLHVPPGCFRGSEFKGDDCFFKGRGLCNLTKCQSQYFSVCFLSELPHSWMHRFLLLMLLLMLFFFQNKQTTWPEPVTLLGVGFLGIPALITMHLDYCEVLYLWFPLKTSQNISMVVNYSSLFANR